MTWRAAFVSLASDIKFAWASQGRARYAPLAEIMMPSADFRARVLAEAKRQPAPTRRHVRLRNALLLLSAVIVPLTVFLATDGVPHDTRPHALLIATSSGAAAVLRSPTLVAASAPSSRNRAAWTSSCAKHRSNACNTGRASPGNARQCASERADIGRRTHFGTRTGLPQVEETLPIRKELRPTVALMRRSFRGHRHPARGAPAGRNVTQSTVRIGEQNLSLIAPCATSRVERRIA